MIDFTYTAKDVHTGEVIKADVKADSPESAAKLLMKQDLFPLDIKAKTNNDILARLGYHPKVSSKERILFTRQLSTLINAGLPLARALRTVEDQIKDQRLREVVGSIVAAIEGGSSLSSAFAQHPETFNEIYVSLVAAGETSGTLDKTLLRLASEQEKDAAIAGKIRSAMIYPAIVLALVLGVVGLMLVAVVPQVASLYKDLGRNLPFTTLALVALSNFVVSFWWLVIVAIVAAVAAARTAMQKEEVKYKIDLWKMKVPIMGVIFTKIYMARFARTMNTLLASGIPMLEAMQTSRDAIGNRVIAGDLDESIKAVRGGKALSLALEKGRHFLTLVPQMTRIGEESGSIDEMLGRTATYYEDEVDEAIRNLSTTLEPVMLVVLGAIVALVLIAVLGPVYSLVGSGAASNIK